MSYLPPSATWPEHPRPLAREALNEARRAGWWLKQGSHDFGVLLCGEPGSEERCKIPVFSTSGPADGSETAKNIRRGLKKCPHYADVPVDVNVNVNVNVNEALRNTEQLLRSIVDLRRADAHENDAIALQDRYLETGDETLEVAAFEALEAAEEARRRAHDAALRGEYYSDWRPDDARSDLIESAVQWLEALSSAKESGHLSADEQEKSRHLRETLDELRWSADDPPG